MLGETNGSTMRIFGAAVLLICSAVTASADHASAIVVPGKPGVPVVLNGVDASWAIVEGDWGLYRPHAAPSAIYGPLLLPMQPYRDGYYPGTGRRPGYGRLERDPGPGYPPPQPAPTYRRSWTSQSDPGPVTEYAPFEPPPVILAPQFDRRGGPRRGP
jgi:hypothetical protein